MSKNVSVIEQEDGLVIKHKSEQELANYWSWGIMQLGFFMLLLSLFYGVGPLMEVSVLMSVTIIVLALIGLKSDSKIQNNLSVNISPEKITIKHESSHETEPLKRLVYGKSIRRMFVTRSRKNNVIKHGSIEKVFCYEIWAEKVNGQKTRILGAEDGFFSKSQNDTEIIIQKIQTVLQLSNDVYSTSIEQAKILKINIHKRKLNKEPEINEMTINDFKKGVLVDYKLETWEIVGEMQYDWGQGNTDTLYQLQNSKNTTILLLVSQDLAIYTTWLESILNYHDLIKYELDKVRHELPLEFTFQGKVFLKQEISSGYQFVEENQPVKIKEWKYISKDKISSLRIIEHENEDVFVFLGKEVKTYEFSNILAY